MLKGKITSAYLTDETLDITVSMSKEAYVKFGEVILISATAATNIRETAKELYAFQARSEGDYTLWEDLDPEQQKHCIDQVNMVIMALGR